MVEGALRDAAQAKQRNDALNKSAFRLGGLVWAGALTEEAAEVRLLQVAEGNGLVVEDGQEACLATIRSGLKDGNRENNFSLPMDLQVDFLSAGVDPATVVVEVTSGVPAAVLEEARNTADRRRREAREREARVLGEWESRFLVHRYHNDLVAGPDEAIDHLLERRISPALWGPGGFNLGWTSDLYGRGAILIPWVRNGHIQTVQGRHIDDQKPKYHWWPEMPGGKLFNADAVLLPEGRDLLVVEGAFNVMRMMTIGFPSVVGLPTVGGFHAEFAPFFRKYERIFFFMDAGAANRAGAISSHLPEARFVILPADPDDFSCSFDSDVEARNAILSAMSNALPL